MKSAILVPKAEGRGYVAKVAETAEPRAGNGELVVAMEACGICGTDIEKIRGEYTASKPVIGHEAVGTVKELGDGTAGFKVGDRVFPHHHVPDYDCFLCRAGNETMCDHYRSSNLVPGGFAEAFTVPSWNITKGGVVRLPDSMSFEVGSLIEPLACCLRALKKTHVELGETALVAGAGPVGMMHLLLLKPTASKVLVSDVVKERLAFAEGLGAGGTVDAKGDVPAAARKETEGRGVDVAMVASGSKQAIVQALRSVRKGGRVCLFGVPPTGTVLDYDVSELYNSEREVITSYGATETDTKEAVRVLAARGEEFGRLITHRFPLGDFDQALSTAADLKAIKVIVTS